MRPSTSRHRRTRFVATTALLAVLATIAIESGPIRDEARAGPPKRFDLPGQLKQYREERKANEKAFHSPEVQARLKAAPKGHWAIIVRGKITAIEATPEAARKSMRAAQGIKDVPEPDLRSMSPEEREKFIRELMATPPRIHHLFFWRVGTGGDVAYDTSWPYESVVGTKFLAATDLSFRKTTGGTVFFTGKPRDLGDCDVPVPSSDGRPILPLDLTAILAPPGKPGLSSRFLVATGYGGPLILPEHVGPEHRMIGETPGLATVSDHVGGIRTYRRYTIRVKNESIGLDAFVEALGNLQSPRGAIERGGAEWRRLDSRVLDYCHDQARPLALLVLDVSRPLPAGTFATPAVREKLDRYARAIHVTPWRAPPGLTGEPFAAPAELVVYRPLGLGENREMILEGRVTLTEKSGDDVKALLDRCLAKTEGTRLIFALERPNNRQSRTELARVLRSRFVETGVQVGWLIGAMPKPLRVDVPGNCRLGVEEVIRRCTTSGKLEFRILARSGDPTKLGKLDVEKEARFRSEDPTNYVPPKSADSDYPAFRWYRLKPDEESTAQEWGLARIDRWNFGGRDLDKVRVHMNPSPPGLDWIITFGIIDVREKDFGDFTGPNSAEEQGDGEGRQLAIILDGVIQSAPVLRSRLTDGGYIEGRFTKGEARDIAIVLRSGPLPLRLTLADRR